MKPDKSSFWRTLITKIVLVILLATLIAATLFFVWTKNIISEKTVVAEISNELELEEERFPVGVDRVGKVIVEDPLVDWYVQTHLSINIDNSRQGRFFERLLSQMSKWDWYQNLASASSRILVIYPGERQEEIVDNIGDILKWTDDERELFTKYIIQAEPIITEGKFFPGRYVVSNEATPEAVADILFDNFKSQILSRYDSEVERQVPLEQALIIASMLEREAYDFTDMRYISGVIWNRLFINMPLQLDATLQYAKGNQANPSKWWSNVVPADKYIDSPFNTYQNKGLPPAAISNPSVEAVVAALNPRITDCMFYFHDTKGKFYCSLTYEEHVEKLKEVYGRGK